jgi:hypothetical protein
MRLQDCITMLAAAVLTTSAQSNFDPAHTVITAETVGALDWSVTPENGASINQFYASGYIYGANIGWIALGATPANSFRYGNDSATDFGINVTPAGELRGYAYGANAGWVNFESLGNPRVDWTTGKLSGRVWAANLGWIELETVTEHLRLNSMAEGADTDADGLPDAWEIQHTSNLASLSDISDADSDGQLDLDEFLAGTSPTNANDFLFIDLTVSVSAGQSVLQWPTKPGYIYYVDQRTSFRPSANWSAAAEATVGTGSFASLTIPFPTAFTFYRIRAYPPLSAPNL